jgi:hypothetical protein
MLQAARAIHSFAHLLKLQCHPNSLVDVIVTIALLLFENCFLSCSSILSAPFHSGQYPTAVVSLTGKLM